VICFWKRWKRDEERIKKEELEEISSTFHVFFLSKVEEGKE